MIRIAREKLALLGKQYPPWFSLPYLVKVSCCVAPLSLFPRALTDHVPDKHSRGGYGEKQSNNGCRRPCHIVQAELHSHAGWAKKKLNEQEGKKEDTYCKEGLARTVGEGMNMERSQTWVRWYLQNKGDRMQL